MKGGAGTRGRGDAEMWEDTGTRGHDAWSGDGEMCDFT